MTTIDTHPYRVWMVEYIVEHGLDQTVEGEGAFDPRAHGKLGAPAQRMLKRVQRHMIAVNKQHPAHPKYPGVKENGILDEATRDALRPDRPSFEDAFLQIAHQDDRLDGEQYYTQGAARWSGVDAVFGKVAVSKTAPKLRGGDCSAGYTRWILWALQQSLGRVPHDIVNGAHWNAGYTGTIIAVCRRVSAPKVGDAILYPNHVTGVVSVRDKTCVSHGRDRCEIYGWDAHHGRYTGFWRPTYSNA